MSFDNINDEIIKQKLDKYEKLNNELKSQLEQYKSLNIDDYEETFKKIMEDTFNYAKTKQEEGEVRDKENADKYALAISIKKDIDKLDIEYLNNVIEYLKSLKQSK